LPPAGSVRLVVIAHKRVWPSSEAESGYATTGGFPLQMRALAELFDATTLCLSVEAVPSDMSGVAIDGERLRVVPLRPLRGSGLARRARLPLWVATNLPRLVRAVRQADAVHVLSPGDVGMVGIVLAEALRRPLYVRHCGNWAVPRTRAERLWRWYMARAAGGRRVMVATGEGDRPPSARNDAMTWIFSTTLTEQELIARRRVRTRPPTRRAALVTVGRQVHLKGTATAIEAVHILAGRDVDTTLDVVGDGPGLHGFRELASRLGVADRVRFHGQVGHEDVLGVLGASDVFVFPTRASEGFPKAVLEALASGLPVVTSSISSLPDLVGRAGVLLDDPSAAAVAAAVEHVLSNAVGYERMSQHAVAAAAGRSLERWRDTLGGLLTERWGPLREVCGTSGAERRWSA
jgi:glycosyltransferase involved in cell wall biosynthesis